MGRRNQKAVHLAIGAAAVALLLISGPATAEFGGLFGSKSKQDEAETTAPPEHPANATGSETVPDPATPLEPEQTDSQGATSFDTLCNNGQGKPEDGV